MSRDHVTDHFYRGLNTPAFAVAHTRQDFRSPPSFGCTSQCVLQRSGDLVTDCSLQVVVKKRDTQYPNVQFGTFYPVEHLVKRVSVSIGGQVIDSHTGDWFRVYDAFFRGSEESEHYRRITNFDASTILSSTQSVETLIVPLCFWFCRRRQDALPLVALYRDEVVISVEFLSAEAVGLSADFELGACLYTTYVYLSELERTEFMTRELVYLPEVVQHQVQPVRPAARDQLVPFSVELNFTHYVKALFWAFKDRGAGHARFVGDSGYTRLALQPNQFSPSGLGLVQTISERLAPLASAAVLFNGNDRWGLQPGAYYNRIQPLQYTRRAPLPGLYMCSFALTPTEVGALSGGYAAAANRQVQLVGQLKRSTEEMVTDMVCSDESVAKNIEGNDELHVWGLTCRILRVRDGEALLDL